MIRISIFGDFRSICPEKIAISYELQSFLRNNNINAVNFEAPIDNNSFPITKSGPIISQSIKSPSYLEEWGFNLISLANNHMMDYGVDALNKTIKSFKKALTVGAGDWENAYKMSIFNVGNKKIGFIGLTHCEFGTLTDKWDKKNTVGCAWINHECVDDLIVKYKQEVDILIVFAHAGVELLDIPLPEWRDRYKYLIKKRADVIVASHPHVPQGWEEYMGKPIFYSLGNFCFQKETEVSLPPYWNNSLCVLLELDDNMNLSYKALNVKYDSFKIGFCDDEEIIDYIKNCLYYISDESIYMPRINKSLIELLPLYYNLFGLNYKSIKYDKNIKNIIRVIYRTLFSKEDSSHIINNLRCESHRWGIQRALKTLYNLN
jgi:poly-gamma-glutamate synthesis protein (capsule biosynthesis protein)